MLDEQIQLRKEEFDGHEKTLKELNLKHKSEVSVGQTNQSISDKLAEVKAEIEKI